MKNLFLPLLVSTFLLLSFTEGKDRKIEAELVNIEYYSKGICKKDYPVYIRVIFSINQSDLSEIKMRHEFTNGITATMPITETDKRGNVVYGFCSETDEIKDFKTVFISQNGSVSNELTVHINVPDAKIIAGTAPRTYKN